MFIDNFFLFDTFYYNLNFLKNVNVVGLFSCKTLVNFDLNLL